MAYTMDELRSRGFAGREAPASPLDFDTSGDMWKAVREIAREEARAVAPKLVKGQVSGGLSAVDQRTDFQRNTETQADGGRYPVAKSFYPATAGEQQWALQKPGGGGLLLLGPEKTTTDKDVGDMVHRDGSQAMSGRLTLSGDPVLVNDAARKGYVDTKETPAAAQQKADVAENSANQYTASYAYSKAQADARYADVAHTHSQYSATSHNHDAAYVNLTEVSKSTSSTLPSGQAWVITPVGSAI